MTGGALAPPAESGEVDVAKFHGALTVVLLPTLNEEAGSLQPIQTRFLAMITHRRHSNFEGRLGHSLGLAQLDLCDLRQPS